MQEMLGSEKQHKVRWVMGLFGRSHTCQKCGRKFGKIEDLMQHQQVIHESKYYECRQCNKSFEGMEQMRDHAKKFHSYNKMKDKNG